MPYILNFSGPHAFHAAYWHDAWGERKERRLRGFASPKDAKWLFAWTEPKVPDGWYGLRATRDFRSSDRGELAPLTRAWR